MAKTRISIFWRSVDKAGFFRWGFIGTTCFMPEFGDNFHLISFSLFQAMFCGTATTIFSGAVAERKALEDHLYRKAFYDSMTGLPNRTLFLDRLMQTLKHQKRNKQAHSAVFLID